MNKFKILKDEWATLQRRYDLEEWTLSLNRAKTSHGVTLFQSKQIKLSVYSLKKNDLVFLRDILLHETAHAIAGHKAGHGPKWKKVAKEIGCTGKRCAGKILESHEKKYVWKCGKGCKINRIKLDRRLLGRTCTKHKVLITPFQRHKDLGLMKIVLYK